MYILGVSYHTDAAACLFKDGKLISAISEERLNRVKSWYGIPHQSIKYVLKINNLKIKNLDLIACNGIIGEGVNKKRYEEIKNKILVSSLSKKQRDEQLFYLKSRLKRENKVYKERIPNYLNELKKYKVPLKIFSHHHCHAASAYYSSRRKNGYILTADGWGEDGLSSTLWTVRNYEMKKISQSGVYDSLGYFYGSITKSIGFIPHRHEGKVLGLAAYGKKNKSLNQIEDCISFDKKDKVFRSHMEKGIYKPQFENNQLNCYLKENQ